MSLQAAFNLRFLYSCALAVGGLCSLEARAETVLESITKEVRSVFDRSKTAVVKIEAIDDHGKLAGTGFFIDPNGTIYTSYTIGGESHDIVVTRGDMKWTATRLVADPHSGIAILKVEAQTPFLPLGKARALEVASAVMAIGYPMDLPVSPKFGTIAGFDSKYFGRYFAVSHIRANVPVQRGEGGSPLLNMNGEVVGILISSIDNGSSCFALPIEAAEKVRNDFMRFGEVRPGWLGICVDLTARPAKDSFAKVESLVEGAPGMKSGLQVGDILTEVGDWKITSGEDMVNASFYLTAGDDIPIAILRNGEKISLKVQTAEHPSLRKRIAPATSEETGIPLKAQADSSPR